MNAPNVLTSLESAAWNETDPELRRGLLEQWVRSGGSARLLARLAETHVSRVRVVEGLSVLVAHGSRFGWKELKPFRKMLAPEVDARLARLIDRPSEIGAFSWLLWVAARTTTSGHYLSDEPSRLEALAAARQEAFERIAASCAAVEATRLPANDLAWLDRLTTQILASARKAATEEPGPDLESMALLNDLFALKRRAISSRSARLRRRLGTARLAVGISAGLGAVIVVLHFASLGVEFWHMASRTPIPQPWDSRARIDIVASLLLELDTTPTAGADVSIATIADSPSLGCYLVTSESIGLTPYLIQINGSPDEAAGVSQWSGHKWAAAPGHERASRCEAETPVPG